ncbi:MAG: hypothetical protein J5645_06625 [Lachnospiraceae bacterium]|nr:hypothetical protein [Lachnospiraceae bacterium]
MFCPKCGAVLLENASRCYECGANVRSWAPVSDEKRSTSVGYESDLKEEDLAFYRRKKAREPLMDYASYQKILMILNIIVCVMLLIVSIVVRNAINRNKAVDAVSAIQFPLVVIAIIILVIEIKAIISVSRLQDSNVHFATAFSFLLVGIVVGLIESLFDETGIGWLLTIASTAFDIGYMYHFCRGASELCEPEEPGIGDRWRTCWKILTALKIGGAVFSVYFKLVVQKSGLTAAELLLYAEIILLVGTLIDVFAYLYFIRNLNRTTEFLWSLNRVNPEENSVQ